MPTVGELSAPYENFMLSPRPGPGVCVNCFNLTDGYERCFACSRNPDVLAVVAPISYSVAHEQLHHALASYKRFDGDAARRLSAGIAAVLWRYLTLHERCMAEAAGVDAFSVVTTVPSSSRTGARTNTIGTIAGRLVAPTRERYAPLLVRTETEVVPRRFNPEKFRAVRPLASEAVLLIDDTWTTGASAQSAAAALRAAGAGPVAAVVVGRHVNRDWRENDRHLRALGTFEWDRCALCAATPGLVTR